MKEMDAGSMPFSPLMLTQPPSPQGQ